MGGGFSFVLQERASIISQTPRGCHRAETEGPGHGLFRRLGRSGLPHRATNLTGIMLGRGDLESIAQPVDAVAHGDAAGACGGSGIGRAGGTVGGGAFFCESGSSKGSSGAG